MIYMISKNGAQGSKLEKKKKVGFMQSVSSESRFYCRASTVGTLHGLMALAYQQKTWGKGK